MTLRERAKKMPQPGRRWPWKGQGAWGVLVLETKRG
jgi:hypothetical protein